MKRPSMRSNEPLEVKMTPMIDVVFLLLVFFVWTSTFETPEFDLPSSLAEVPTGGSEQNADAEPPIEEFDEIVIKLRMQEGVNLIELNGQTLGDITELSRKVREIIELGVQPPVVVDPDDRINMDFAIQVYDVTRSAGADRVLFAVRAEE